jgi:hypothetical protein
MDDNKLEKLRELGYTVRRCCANCIHLLDNPPSNWWSTCMVHQYEHGKHTDNPRQLSVPYCGCCSKHEFHPQWGKTIHSFSEFIETKPGNTCNNGGVCAVCGANSACGAHISDRGRYECIDCITERGR